MKQIKFIAMAVAALAMFSCAKEKNFVNDEAQGEPVYAQFDIKLPSQVSRATGDGNGTDAEEAVADVTVYIITNGKVEAVATGTTVGKTAKVQITTGKKQILAVVNGTACGLTAFTEGAALGDIDLAVIGSAANAVKAETGTGTIKHVLFTSKMMAQEIKAPTAAEGIESKPWNIPIAVEHAMAKVVVRNNIVARINGVTATIGSKTDADPTKDTRPKFALNGMVSNAALYQHLDPNGLVVNSTNTTKAIAWDWRTTPATTGGTPVAKLSFMPMAGSMTGTTPTNPDLNTITGEGKNGGIYTLEGVVASGSANNKSTQIYAKVDILPDASFTTATNTVGAKIADDDNYLVVKHATLLNNYRFFKPADFATWKTNNTEEAKKYESTGVEYTKGENYYLVKIVHDAAVATHKFSVLRNNIYEVTLKNVNAFGSNESGTIVTPSDPIETNVWIEATITLAKWTVKSQTSDLE